jgi:hypothetical protein
MGRCHEMDRGQQPNNTGPHFGNVRDAALVAGLTPIRAYFDLRDALAEPGCPVCGRVLRAGGEAVAALVAGSAPAAQTRRSGVAFRGLCNAHTRSIQELAPSGVGLGDMYEGWVRGRIETLQRAHSRIEGAPQRSWLARAWAWRPPRRWRRRCAACRTAEGTERRDLLLLLDLIEDMEFARAFEASGGLCLPHLDLVQRLAPNHPNLSRLLEAHIPKVKHLQADFQDFLRRAKAPLPTLAPGEAETVWARMLEWAEGKATVFGPERDPARQGVGWRRLLALARRIRIAPLAPIGDRNEGNRTSESHRLALENEKLQRRLVEVSREWAEESARRAALQYQVHKLSEDVKVLELNLAGARGEAQAGEIHAARLREEIDALQREVERLRSQRADAQAASAG